jgi:hypothetical protein
VIQVSSVPEVISLSLSAGGFGISGASLDLTGSQFSSYYAPKYGLISDTALLSGTLTIPPIPQLLPNGLSLPLDGLIDTQTRLMSANF